VGLFRCKVLWGVGNYQSKKVGESCGLLKSCIGPNLKGGEGKEKRLKIVIKQPFKKVDQGKMKSEKGKRFMDECADRAITVYKNQRGAMLIGAKGINGGEFVGQLEYLTFIKSATSIEIRRGMVRSKR